MKTMVMLPYKETSGGSRMLAQALRIARIHRHDAFDPQAPTVVLNWGRGDYPDWARNVHSFLNDPKNVMKAIDKVAAFKMFKKFGVPTPDWTTSYEKAVEWAKEGKVVFCRSDPQGFNASGLVIARKPQEIIGAPLYTLYAEKLNEYRVHVMNGECFYANIKTKKREVPKDSSPLVRSGSHGWFFRHMDDLPSKRVQEACVAAVEAVGLDFGGVDVGESRDGTPYVYEVNTAPEMGPNTTAAYLRAIKKHYGQYNNNENVPIRNL